jgi:hypothetical protein
MTRTLPLARSAFVAAIERDTPGTDLPRLVKVLDTLVAWSVARPALLAFKEEETKGDVISFERPGTKVVVWTAQVVRGSGPRLELFPPSGKALSPEERAEVMQTLNAHARPPLAEGDRLRIGFGALKNDAARAAVLELLKQLLVPSGKEAPSAAASRA